MDLVSSSNSSLNTRKIDRNIEKLRELAVLMSYECHHKSFYVNLKVRKYLQSHILVSRLQNSEKSKKKFIHLLEEVAQLREKNNLKPHLLTLINRYKSKCG